jgi:hypothetical protein
MFLRFAAHSVDERTSREIGLFTALYRLETAGSLSNYETSWFGEQERWFNEHLQKPSGLTTPAAVLWFKSTATEHITRMRALVELLEHKDVPVVVLETDKPGYIVYEDDHQIAAVPFARETFRP